MLKFFTPICFLLAGLQFTQAQDQVLPVFYNQNVNVSKEYKSTSNNTAAARLLLKMGGSLSGKENLFGSIQYKINNRFSAEVGGGFTLPNGSYMSFVTGKNELFIDYEKNNIYEYYPHDFIEEHGFSPIISVGGNYHFFNKGLNGAYLGLGVDWTKIKSDETAETVRNVMTSLNIGYQAIGKHLMFGISVGGGYNRLKAHIEPDNNTVIYDVKSSTFSFEMALRIGIILLKDKNSNKN